MTAPLASISQLRCKYNARISASQVMQATGRSSTPGRAIHFQQQDSGQVKATLGCLILHSFTSSLVERLLTTPTL